MEPVPTIPIGGRISPDLNAELQRWMDAQTVRPTLTAVIEEALRALMVANPVEPD